MTNIEMNGDQKQTQHQALIVINGREAIWQLIDRLEGMVHAKKESLAIYGKKDCELSMDDFDDLIWMLDRIGRSVTLLENEIIRRFGFDNPSEE